MTFSGYSDISYSYSSYLLISLNSVLFAIIAPRYKNIFSSFSDKLITRSNIISLQIKPDS